MKTFLNLSVALLPILFASAGLADGPGPNAKICSREGGIDMYCDYEQLSVWFALTADQINQSAIANDEKKGVLVDPPSMFTGLIKTAIDERVFKPIYDKQPAIGRKVLRILKRNSPEETSADISNLSQTVLSPAITVNWPAHIQIRVYGRIQFQSDYNRGVYTPNPADNLFHIGAVANDETIGIGRLDYTWGQLGCATRTQPMLPFLNCVTSTDETFPNGGYAFNVFNIAGASRSAISKLKVRVLWDAVDKRAAPLWFLVERIEFMLIKSPDGSVFTVPEVEP